MRELDDIERDANAATPGPWTTNKTTLSRGEWGNQILIAAVARGQGVHAEANGGSFPEADRRFIAAARADVPEMAAEIRRLRGVVDALSHLIDEEKCATCGIAPCTATGGACGCDVGDETP